MALVRLRPLGYLCAFVAAAALGRLAVLPGTGLSLFWPAAGVGALWLLRGTTRREVVLDGTLLVLTTTLFFAAVGMSPLPCLLIGLANLVQALVVRLCCALLEHRPWDGSLSPEVTTTRDLIELCLASGVAALCSSLIGLIAARLNSGSWSSMALVAWAVRNACGTFVVAASVLAITATLRTKPWRRPLGLITTEPRAGALLELTGAVAVSAVSALVVFTASEQLPIAYLMIATSAWIGLRFSPVVAALHTLGFGALCLGLTLSGEGPFGAVDDLTVQAVVVQLFVAVTAMIVLMLSLGVAERITLTSRLRESEARATERAELLDAVTHVMTDGLLVMDAEGRVLLNNPAAVALAGARAAVEHEDSSGMTEHGFFELDGSPIPEHDKPAARAVRGETVAPTDYLRVDPVTGERGTVSVSATPLEHGGHKGGRLAVVAIHDVTTERSQRRELEAFAGVVAHDLRTPLTGVLSWAEVLQEQVEELSGVPGVASLRGSARRLHSSATRMDHLIGDLLAYSQAQSAVLSPLPLQLDDLLEDVVTDLRDAHPANPPVVEHTGLGPVLADRALVRQVFANLLGNAVKYVAPGTTPHVVVGAVRSGDMIEIRITDNGIGIPEKERGKVFDSFYRASSSGDYPGTGIGLAICARAVTRHGGRISARRGLSGRGTTMVFTLPADPDALPVLDQRHLLARRAADVGTGRTRRTRSIGQQNAAS